MNFTRPDTSAPVHIVCYVTGGASIASADGAVWCGSTRLQGWHTGEGVEDHARYFTTVNEALRFARGCGWVTE